MIKGSIDSIESFGLVDGPGIRTVVFFNGCQLRCKYCHNPEMWQIKEKNYTVEELVQKILRNKPYFKNNQGGVTFSGGEPLLQIDFLLEVCKRLKEEDIHIALDTSGVGLGDYDEILSYVDLVIFDVKHVTEEGYLNVTSQTMEKVNKFILSLNKNQKKVWIRQVIIPDINDNKEYLKKLAIYLKQFHNIEKIEFLPYHKMGDEKYQKLGLLNPYLEKEAMDQVKCEELFSQLMKEYRNG